MDDEQSSQAILTPSTQEPTQENKPEKWLIITFVLLFIFTTGIAGYFAYQNYQLKKELEKEVKPTPSLIQSPPSNSTKWETYENSFYSLELKYPQSYSLSENSDYIEISSPLSKCNPKLIFNTEKYENLHELQIYLKKRRGSLKKVLESEGGEAYGWKQTTFNDRRAYLLAYGAEMITPVENYLIESKADEVLEIKIYMFASDDLGKCIPKLDTAQAAVFKDKILSTFKFSKQTEKKECVDSNEQCQGKPDETECTYGIWCDKEGKICGGQSCVGLGLGVCRDNKCEIN